MNDNIFFFFYNLAHQNYFWDSVIIFFAVHFPYLVILSALSLLLLRKETFPHPMSKFREIFVVFFSTVSDWFLSYILKFLFHTVRPFDLFQNVISLFPESGYAFPSAHATFFMALAVSVFFYNKRVGYIFTIFAVLIGLARITAGVHFPVDILGGFVLGFLVSIVVRHLYNYFNRK